MVALLLGSLAFLAIAWSSWSQRGAARTSVAAVPSSSPVPATPPVPALPPAAAPAVIDATPPAASSSAAQPLAVSPAVKARAEPPARPRPTARDAAKATNPGVPATTPAVVENALPPPQPVASAPAVAPAASALCADRRFIAYAVCLQAECDKPSMRQHPQCVRMREQQEALRRGSGDS